MDGFEQLGQLAGDDQRALAEYGGEIGDGFDDAMRRFVEDQRAGMAAQFLDRRAALAGLARQEAMEQEMLVEAGRRRRAP
jgi:hypothetical protein